MENHHFYRYINYKWAMINSYVTNYQMVNIVAGPNSVSPKFSSKSWRYSAKTFLSCEQLPRFLFVLTDNHIWLVVWNMNVIFQYILEFSSSQLTKRYAYWPCPTCSCFHVLSMISHAQFWRVGEALNPGPVVVRTFNPAQLLGHESEICKWPDGIWTASETSHTAAALGVLKRRFSSKRCAFCFSASPLRNIPTMQDPIEVRPWVLPSFQGLQLVPYPMELET